MVNEHTLVDACHLQFAEKVVRIDQQRVAAEATHGRARRGAEQAALVLMQRRFHDALPNPQ
jgi:hypothetical protein